MATTPLPLVPHAPSNHHTTLAKHTGLAILITAAHAGGGLRQYTVLVGAETERVELEQLLKQRRALLGLTVPALTCQPLFIELSVKPRLSPSMTSTFIVMLNL